MSKEEIELIAARELLRRWIRKFAASNKPGAWNYDKDAADLIEVSAKLVGIEDPFEFKYRKL